MHEKGQKSTAGALLYHRPPYFLRKWISVNLELVISIWLSSQWASVAPIPQCCGYSIYQFGMWVLEFQSQALMLAQWAYSPWSHISSSKNPGWILKEELVKLQDILDVWSRLTWRSTRKGLSLTPTEKVVEGVCLEGEDINLRHECQTPGGLGLTPFVVAFS